MTFEISPWLNRIGLVLDFVAFCCASPEILGKKKLQNIERALEKLIVYLYKALTWFLVALSTVLEIIVNLFTLSNFTELTVGWLNVALYWLTDRLNKILSRLTDDSKLRARALLVGAIFFVAGFILQLLGTF